MRKILILGVILMIGLGLGVLAADTITVQDIVNASNALQTFQATIFMARYTGNKKAEIEFHFEFIPPAKMRIEYISPKNLVGQLVILNGDQLYTFLPALNRAVRKTITKGSDHPGEEMGFLYYFVNRELEAFIRKYAASEPDSPHTFTWQYNKNTITYQAYKLTFTGKDKKQVVWCDATTLVPIAVDIYNGDKLTIEVRVIDYVYNGSIPDEEFSIPK